MNLPAFETLNKKITDRQRKAFWSAVMLLNLFVQSLWTPNSIFSVFISPISYFAINILFVGICMAKRIYREKKIYILALCFIGWHIVCCIVNSGASGPQESDFKASAILLSSWGLALPFVTLTGDFDKKRVLTVLFSVLTVLFTVVVWAALIPTFLRTCFYLPVENTLFGIKEAYEQNTGIVHTYPVFFDMHYYYTAYISTLGFFMALYLFVQEKMRPVTVFGMIGFVLALSLIKCRLALLSFGAGLFTVGFFFFRSKFRNASWQKTILGRVVIALAVALCLVLMWSFGTYVSNYILVGRTNDNMKRSFSNRLLDGHGRLHLWSLIPDMLKDYAPTSYLFGIDKETLYPFIFELTGMNHMHSGYFSALMLMGIPGFLLSLVFAFLMAKDILYIFLKIKDHGLKNNALLLLPIPVCLLFAAVGEPILFVGYDFRIISLVFYLVSGYVFELTDRLRKEEASLKTADAGGEVQAEAQGYPLMDT